MSLYPSPEGGVCQDKTTGVLAEHCFWRRSHRYRVADSRLISTEFLDKVMSVTKEATGTKLDIVD